MLELVKRKYNRATMWDQLERLAEGGARVASTGLSSTGSSGGGLFAGVSKFTR